MNRNQNSLRAVGQQGEDLAREYLEKKGYTFREANWQFGHLELDLVMQEGETIVYVEVKLRRSSTLGQPEEAITPGKLRRTARAAEAYQAFHCLDDYEMRVDCVCIMLDPWTDTVQRWLHLQNLTWHL